MNKKIASISILILALLTFTPNSFAAFDEYKIVGSSGSFDEKTVFGFNDPSPYLYMKLPDSGAVFTGSFWRDPDASIFYVSTKNTGPEANRISASGSGSVSGLERWITLSNWNTVKKVGEWEVNSNYFYTNGDTGFGTAGFTVTPEPLAMTLFLVGGAPIAVGLLRRRKLQI